MTLGVRILGRGSQAEVQVHPNPSSGQPSLVIMTPAQAHGHWRAATRTTAGTTVIIPAKPGRAIVITDIIVSGEKQAASSATIQFTDDTATEVVIVADQVDATPTLSANLQAWFRGWVDARIELVTAGAGDVTVTIGYIHERNPQSYAEWDAER